MNMNTVSQAEPIRLGDVAPDFKAESTAGPIEFHKWIGDSWCLLFSHPKDFTPVCTTELGVVARLSPEFARRKVKALAVSVDPLKSHQDWIKDIDETQHAKVQFPIVADPDRRVASLYGMIHPKASETFTVRTVFVIDPSKKVRLTMTYPAATGRNFEEILRVVDALQLTDRASVATPANWRQGGDCIILPSVQDPGELREKFPKGFKQLKPYLRLTPQP
jgi:alkyl hydroperoxide reductase subunit AhpC